MAGEEERVAVPERQRGSLSPQAPAGRAHGAAEVRKRLRRELRRAGAGGVSLYIDGTRGTVRLATPGRGREATVPIAHARAVLDSLSDGIGVEAVLDALARE